MWNFFLFNVIILLELEVLVMEINDLRREFFNYLEKINDLWRLL